MPLRSIGRKVNEMPLPYRTKHGAGSGGFSLDAPVLAFASATNPSNDNTQDFDAIFFESIEGRTLRLVGTEGSATVGAFDIDVSNAIDAAEDLASEASFTTGAIADGVCSFKCRIEDGSGNALSDWSNTVSKTIDTTAPTITSATTANNAENSVLSHSLTANETVTWTVTGGADQARFEISGSTLRWASNGTKDYETPNDADTNNTYVVQVTATDTAGNTANQTVTITVTNVDDTAPSLSSATDTATGQTTADVGVDTDEANGTLYCVVTTSSTSPTAAQVKAGQDNSGVAAAYASNQAIASTGTKAFSATGLTASTAYTAHFMHEDAIGNQSTVVKGNGFTTAADAPTFERTAALNFVGSGTSHTFSATDIGDASATKVLLIFAFCAGAATTVSSLTVGGNAATLLTGTNLSSSGVGSSAFKIEIASGDPEDIAVTWNATVSSMGIIVYALDGVDPTETARVSSAAFGASDVNTITVPTDGFAISGSLLQNSTAEGVWSNCTEDGTRVFIAGGTGVPMQSAHTTTAGSQSPTIDPTGSDIIIHHTIAFGP